VNWYN